MNERFVSLFKGDCDSVDWAGHSPDMGNRLTHRRDVDPPRRSSHISAGKVLGRHWLSIMIVHYTQRDLDREAFQWQDYRLLQITTILSEFVTFENKVKIHVCKICIFYKNSSGEDIFEVPLSGIVFHFT